MAWDWVDEAMNTMPTDTIIPSQGTTYQGSMTQICVSKLDHDWFREKKDLSPIQHQAIIWTN